MLPGPLGALSLAFQDTRPGSATSCAIHTCPEYLLSIGCVAGTELATWAAAFHNLPQESPVRRVMPPFSR